MSTSFPAPPPKFLSIASPDKARIFVLTGDEYAGPRGTLTQIATVPGTPETITDLVDALNHTAWTGEREGLEVLLSTFPTAVAQSLEEALAHCPEPGMVALGDEQQPLNVISEIHFGSDLSDLLLAADAAVTLGLGFIVENTLEDDGRLNLIGRLLSESAHVEHGQESSWWPIPAGRQLLERVTPVSSMHKVFTDRRWETHAGRAFWVWLEDERQDDSEGAAATATWVVEFVDTPLSPETNFRVFIPGNDTDEERMDSLTPRNRFVLWQALWGIRSELDDRENSWDESLVYRSLNDVVGHQPQTWWEKLYEASDRLCEAARTGNIDDLIPRTVGEEALIMLATQPQYVGTGKDAVTIEYQTVFDTLPQYEADEEWSGILPQLVGDTDIEMLWSPEFAGTDNPDHPINQILGIGDKRPHNWHNINN
jgi:hypothetical protein